VVPSGPGLNGDRCSAVQRAASVWQRKQPSLLDQGKQPGPSLVLFSQGLANIAREDAKFIACGDGYEQLCAPNLVPSPRLFPVACMGPPFNVPVGTKYPPLFDGYAEFLRCVGPEEKNEVKMAAPLIVVLPPNPAQMPVIPPLDPPILVQLKQPIVLVENKDVVELLVEPITKVKQKQKRKFYERAVLELGDVFDGFNHDNEIKQKHVKKKGSRKKQFRYKRAALDLRDMFEGFNHENEMSVEPVLVPEVPQDNVVLAANPALEVNVNDERKNAGTESLNEWHYRKFRELNVLPPQVDEIDISELKGNKEDFGFRFSKVIEYYGCFSKIFTFKCEYVKMWAGTTADARPDAVVRQESLHPTVHYIQLKCTEMVYFGLGATAMWRSWMKPIIYDRVINFESYIQLISNPAQTYIFDDTCLLDNLSRRVSSMVTVNYDRYNSVDRIMEDTTYLAFRRTQWGKDRAKNYVDFHPPGIIPPRSSNSDILLQNSMDRFLSMSLKATVLRSLLIVVIYQVCRYVGRSGLRWGVITGDLPTPSLIWARWKILLEDYRRASAGASPLRPQLC